jgi:hypothetical protein
MLDFSKLSPMTRYSLLRDLYTKASTELYHFNNDIKNWEADGSVNSNTGKEMVAWRDALKELTDQIQKEKNAVVDGNGG